MPTIMALIRPYEGLISGGGGGKRGIGGVPLDSHDMSSTRLAHFLVILLMVQNSGEPVAGSLSHYLQGYYIPGG